MEVQVVAQVQVAQVQAVVEVKLLVVECHQVEVSHFPMHLKLDCVSLMENA